MKETIFVIDKTEIKFKEMLLSTKREGMENVIEKLEELGFFKAPASTKFHLNYEGGLLEQFYERVRYGT